MNRGDDFPTVSAKDKTMGEGTIWRGMSRGEKIEMKEGSRAFISIMTSRNRGGKQERKRLEDRHSSVLLSERK